MYCNKQLTYKKQPENAFWSKHRSLERKHSGAYIVLWSESILEQISHSSTLEQKHSGATAHWQETKHKGRTLQSWFNYPHCRKPISTK